MKLKELIERPDIKGNEKLDKAYNQLGILINELSHKNMPDAVIIALNEDIEGLNSIEEGGKNLKIQVKKKQTSILKLVEKELQLVAKNHYRNTWMAVGMAAFGIPFGVIFGISLGNMAYIAMFLPVGMGIGIAIGTHMDNKALEEGRQLGLEL